MVQKHVSLDQLSAAVQSVKPSMGYSRSLAIARYYIESDGVPFSDHTVYSHVPELIQAYEERFVEYGLTDYYILGFQGKSTAKVPQAQLRAIRAIHRSQQ